MTTGPASTVSCPRSSKTSTWGRLPTIEMTSSPPRPPGQRPAWTFPGRWLPMADIADRRAFAPHVPWRTIGAVAPHRPAPRSGRPYVGTRPARVPPPFGPARNGGIVFANGGDIFIGDPVSGTSRAIVTGPEMDGNPLFARDGTRVAFMRRVGDPVTPTFDLVVAKADGSGPKVVAPIPSIPITPMSGRRTARTWSSPIRSSASIASMRPAPPRRLCSSNRLRPSQGNSGRPTDGR